MKVRGVPASALAEAGARLAVRSVRIPRGAMQALLEETAGRGTLSRDERRLVSGVDRAMQRLGVRCLRRSVVVAEMLRRRGVAARVRLSVDAARPRHAHAEVEVGGEPLGPRLPGMVPLR